MLFLAGHAGRSVPRTERNDGCAKSEERQVRICFASHTFLTSSALVLVQISTLRCTVRCFRNVEDELRQSMKAAMERVMVDFKAKGRHGSELAALQHGELSPAEAWTPYRVRVHSVSQNIREDAETCDFQLRI